MSSGPPSRVLLSAREVRELESGLTTLRYRGIPIGAALNDYLVVNFLWGHGNWRSATKLINRMRMVRHWLLVKHAIRARPIPRDRILVTWQGATPRFDDLLLPVVDQIGPDRCQVLLGGGNEVPAGLPREVPSLKWDQSMRFRPQRWRAEYGHVAGRWHERLQDLCQQYHLPAGAFELLALRLLRASQWIEGCLGLLEQARPPLVLTEYDRNYRWSCLVLAAQYLQIPTVTLVHGVIPPDAIGFSPVLADVIVCWGEADRKKLAAAGEPLEKIIIGGCPRLTRELPLDSAAARLRLGLPPDKPPVLLATSPDRDHLNLAEMFATALEHVPAATGVVRLHPAETLSDYAEVARRHPQIRFMDSSAGTIDEALAASEIVVVRGSGVGSDALLKRRPAVVLSPDGTLRGNDADLVLAAGCPLATTPEQLRQTVARLLAHDEAAVASAEQAERYLADFCGAFGTDSARLIGKVVDDVLGSPGPRSLS